MIFSVFHRLVLLVSLLVVVGVIGFGLGNRRDNLADHTIALPRPKDLVAIVPHHDLVKDRRQKMLSLVSLRSQPETIILLSPNHFDAGGGSILMSDQPWVIDGGKQTIESNKDLVTALVSKKVAQVDHQAFEGEHGVKNLLSDIHQFFPDSKVVPIIFKENTTRQEVTGLAQELLFLCPNQCGVIASVDMSHYQPARLAGIHDQKTLRVLENLDSDEIWQAEVDSNQSLALAIQWAKQRSLERFNLFDQTNSGLLVNNFETETTSHIFGFYSAEEKVKPVNSLTFTFGGDGMFGREIGYQFQNNHFKDLFSQLGNRTFWGTDVSWINLEGPISDQSVVQDRAPNNLSFNFSKETIEALKFLKLTTVGLANNHTLNQGKTGLAITKKMLEDNQIDWVGEPDKITEVSLKRFDRGEIAVSIIAVHALIDASEAQLFIEQESKRKRLVIVLPHWGNEYQLTHSRNQESLAQAWIKAGADLIVGAHPHVVQDAQIIDNRLVIYSLGNFVFDQYFSNETQIGLIVGGVITSDRLKLVLVPVESQQLKPQIARGDNRDKIINRICASIVDQCNGDTIELSLD